MFALDLAKRGQRRRSQLKPTQYTAVNIKTTPGVRSYAHRPKGAVLVMVLAASLATLLPNTAQGHQVSGAKGVGGATIDVSPDGYEEPFYINGRQYAVTGANFIANLPALIFQCPVTRNVPAPSPGLDLSPLPECKLLGQTIGQPDGSISTSVHMERDFRPDQFLRIPSSGLPGGPRLVGSCYGPDQPTQGVTTDWVTEAEFSALTTTTSTIVPSTVYSTLDTIDTLVPRSFQCSVVALQFAPNTDLSIIAKMAEHYICFEGEFIGAGQGDDTKCYRE